MSPASEPERIQELEERARIADAQVRVELERNALQQIPERDAEHERRHGAAHEDAPVPRVAPTRILDLASIVEADGAKEQREQREDQRNVKAGERGGVDERPGRERRAARGDEPDLVALPVGPDAVQHDPPLVVGAAHERQQRPDAEIHPVHDGEADEQDPDEGPPDELEGRVVEEVDHWTVRRRP